MPPSSSFHASSRRAAYYADPPPTFTGRNSVYHAGTHINKRALSVENIPYPPPPYTPTIALHAATLTPGVKDPSLPPKSTPGQQPTGTHTGPLVAALLAGTLLLLAAAVTLVILVKSKRVQLPCCSSRKRYRKSARYSRRSTAMSRKSTAGREKSPIQNTDDLFSRVSRVLEYSEKEPFDEVFTSNSPQHSPAYERLRSDDGSLPRRYSSPQMLYERSPVLQSPETPTPRPLSLPGRELSSLIQKQRLAELAQIQRMKQLQEDARVYRATPPISRRSSMLHGLGIIPEELEVDVGNTNLANLQHYPFLAGGTPALKSAPFSDHDHATELESSSSTSSETIKQISETCSEPMSLEAIRTNTSETLSSMAETEALEDDIGEVRMAHTQSVEIKRGVLVSLHNSVISVPQFIVSTPSVRSLSHLAISPSTSSQDFLSPHDIPSDESIINLSAEPSSDTIGQTITSFPSPPPMLSPITTSSFTFTAEIEQGLGAKVLDYRRSNMFAGLGMSYVRSKEDQLLALAEALDFDQPRTHY